GGCCAPAGGIVAPGRSGRQTRCLRTEEGDESPRTPGRRGRQGPGENQLTPATRRRSQASRGALFAELRRAWQKSPSPQRSVGEAGRGAVGAERKAVYLTRLSDRAQVVSVDRRSSGFRTSCHGCAPRCFADRADGGRPTVRRQGAVMLAPEQRLQGRY